MKYLVLVLFFSLISQAEEISPLWRVLPIDRKDIVGLTKDGNGICLNNHRVDFGDNERTAEELAISLDPRVDPKVACRSIESLPDSELNAYQCPEGGDCSKKFLAQLNKEYNCGAQIQKVLPRETQEKKIGSVIVFRSKDCRLSLVNHKIPCASGLTSRYLSPDQKGYKICFKSTGGSNSSSSPPSSAGVH